MRLVINNIGLVKEADIKLEGLTIIAGENDTGKSTVGKSLFSLIKGINIHQKDFKEVIFTQIEEIIDSIYFKIRKISKEFKRENSIEEVSMLYPPNIRRDLLKYLRIEDFQGLRHYVQKYKEQLKNEMQNMAYSGASQREQNALLREVDYLVSQLNEIVHGSQNPRDFITDTIMQVLKLEFGTDICNKYEEECSKILYEENGRFIFKADLKDDDFRQAQFAGGPLEIEDATYIESPSVFQMHKMILETNLYSSTHNLNFSKRTKARKKTIPFHVEDLISKMSDSSYYNIGLENENQKFIDEISEIIEGESVLDRDLNEFSFERRWENEIYSFDTSNVASGIKSFSMIQMLLKAQMINERSILIIDEPEIHLHPKWQVKYCEIIVKLASLGVKVLVTSHSPYIIQALKVLAQKYKINSNVNFYLAEKESQSMSTNIVNVNDDLNSVFKKLSDPLQKLIWEK